MPPVASALPEAVPENRLLEPDAAPVVDWLRIVQGEPLLQMRTASLTAPANANPGERARDSAIQPVSLIGAELYIGWLLHATNFCRQNIRNIDELTQQY